MAKKKTFGGQLGLEETSIKVVEFESLGWVVSTWQPSGDKNEFTFELHPEGGRPTPCVFRRRNAKALPGFEKQGTGRLLDGGEEVDVALFRWVG